MKLSQFKSIIKEAVKEAVTETIKEVLIKELRNNNLNENQNINFNSSDVHKFAGINNTKENMPDIRSMYGKYLEDDVPKHNEFRGTVDNGVGEVSLEQIRNITGLKF